jgi:hypothetical protein
MIEKSRLIKPATSLPANVAQRLALAPISVLTIMVVGATPEDERNFGVEGGG